ncbi:MAG: hypothetical protein L0G59_07665, partial [Kocuria sp.]|nr:hypothetical protein [Kocuria sp.]
HVAAGHERGIGVQRGAVRVEDVSLDEELTGEPGVVRRESIGEEVRDGPVPAARGESDARW